jgi:hypothetical protein
VSPTEYPGAEPRRHARHNSAVEVLRLWRGGDVPGIDEAHTRVQGIRACVLDNPARMAIVEALRAGYLYVNPQTCHHGAERRLATLWAWWSAAARHPELVVSTMGGSDPMRVRCDLSPTERTFGFDAFRSVGRYQQHPVERRLALHAGRTADHRPGNGGAHGRALTARLRGRAHQEQDSLTPAHDCPS